MDRSRALVIGLLAAVSLTAAAAGCGGDDPAAGGRIEIVATTAIAADIARQVAGDRAQVTQLIPDSATPHTFQASAEDRQAIADADLLVSVGNGLEPTVPTDDAAEVFVLGEHAGPLLEGESSELDPHVWMDPTRIARALPDLAETLESIEPEAAAGFDERAEGYAQRLGNLDRSIAADVAAIDSGARALVTSHDALGYFADRYGFEVVATPFGLSPEAEPSALDVQTVIEAVREHDVPALFVEQGDDPQILERIAEATGAEVVDDLLVEGFAPGVDSYEAMVRFTAKRITDALEG